MKVLIIDDSDYKVESLEAVIREFDSSAEISFARSFRSGVRAARIGQPDLILLDMSLPTFEISRSEAGGRTRPFGGREILRELEITNDLTKIVVVTQFDRFGEHNQSRDELMTELHEEFSNWLVGGIYYSVVDSHWREELLRLLVKTGD